MSHARLRTHHTSVSWITPKTCLIYSQCSVASLAAPITYESSQIARAERYLPPITFSIKSIKILTAASGDCSHWRSSTNVAWRPERCIWQTASTSNVLWVKQHQGKCPIAQKLITKIGSPMTHCPLRYDKLGQTYAPKIWNHSFQQLNYLAFDRKAFEKFQSWNCLP